MGQMWEKEVKGRGAQEPGKGGLKKSVEAVSLTTPIKVMTQRHRIPVSTPSPSPIPTVQTWLCKEVPRALWNSYNGWHGV